MRPSSASALLLALLCISLGSWVPGQVRVRIKAEANSGRSATTKVSPKPKARPNTRTAEAEKRKAEWRARVATAWAKVSNVSVNVDPKFRDTTQRWLERGERDHAYKIVLDDGRTEYGATPPEDDFGVRDLFQRVAADVQIQEYGARNRLHSHVWVRMSFIAEEKRWIRGDGLKHRWTLEDRLYRKWISQVLMHPEIKASGLTRLTSSLISTLSGIQTDRRTLEDLRTGRKHAMRSQVAAIELRTKSLRRRSDALKKNREKLEVRLLAVGSRLAVGDLLWTCESKRIEIWEQVSKTRMAEAKMRTLASRSKRDPELAPDFAEAKTDWDVAVTRVVEMRKARRVAMARVMRVLGTAVARPPR